ncbi:hypothetical protein HMPREF0201_01915 [Cedecea davisae DSM 4568]|uniref:Uncharacterized protein n=1 Tax=Cedecea davisae DSM 4568 TaxID=566551 RepID=S3IV02_9ENTR|nr:hypothetical protein HMPREF0201_01915 [Cedecea davisae DSM 4568]
MSIVNAARHSRWVRGCCGSARCVCSPGMTEIDDFDDNALTPF